MTTIPSSPIIDADGHVLEPADMYTNYIDPKFRDRALRIACDEKGHERWIVEFCRENPKRLYPIAHISLLDPEGAVEETLRARKEGCIGVYLSPDLAARRDKRLDDPSFSRFWETVQDLQMRA